VGSDIIYFEEPFIFLFILEELRAAALYASICLSRLLVDAPPKKDADETSVIHHNKL
jgi:hypothetical protein